MVYVHVELHLLVVSKVSSSLVPRPRPAFRRLQYGKAASAFFRATETARGPGNEARSPQHAIDKLAHYS